MKRYRLLEAEAFQADLERIGAHLDVTTGNFTKTDEILLDFRRAVDDLVTLPKRHAERADLGDGIRLCLVRQKGIVLYRVDEGAGDVFILRAFYGGEDYETIFRGAHDR